MTAEEISRWMREALWESSKALPMCLPNPPVGCVVVSQRLPVARGFTRAPGAGHAEAVALSQLSGTYSDLSVFVTLEPCSFHGRTPSCARAIVSRNVAHVYVGIIDPHPRNCGAGIEILRDAGIDVEVGVLAEEVRTFLDPYLIRSAP